MNTDTALPFDRTGLDDCWNRIGVHGDGSCPELLRHVHCRNCPVYSATAARLLDSDLPTGQIDEWTEHFSRPRTSGAAATHAVVIFRLGAEWLALPAAVLMEVTTRCPVHTLPHRRNDLVLGLVNIRGSLLVCVSLGAVLGLEKPPLGQSGETPALPPRLLVTGREGHRLVLPVDEVHGIYRCRPDELQAAPATVARAATTYVTAVLAWRDRTVGCLDDQLLFYTLNRSLA